MAVIDPPNPEYLDHLFGYLPLVRETAKQNCRGDTVGIDYISKYTRVAKLLNKRCVLISVVFNNVRITYVSTANNLGWGLPGVPRCLYRRGLGERDVPLHPVLVAADSWHLLRLGYANPDYDFELEGSLNSIIFDFNQVEDMAGQNATIFDWYSTVGNRRQEKDDSEFHPLDGERLVCVQKLVRFGGLITAAHKLRTSVGDTCTNQMLILSHGKTYYEACGLARDTVLIKEFLNDPSSDKLEKAYVPVYINNSGDSESDDVSQVGGFSNLEVNGMVFDAASLLEDVVRVGRGPWQFNGQDYPRRG